MTRADALAEKYFRRVCRAGLGSTLQGFVLALSFALSMAHSCLAGNPTSEVRVVVICTSHSTYYQAAAAAEATLTGAGYEVTDIKLPRGFHTKMDAGLSANGKTSSSPSDRSGPATSAGSQTGGNQSSSEVQQTVQQLIAAKPSIVVAVGDEATFVALETLPSTPVVFSMIPNALDMPFLSSDYAGRDHVAGVTTDVDPVQQIEWVKTTCPQLKVLSVPYSPRASRTAESIGAAGKARGIDVRLIDACKEQFGCVFEAFEHNGCEGMLMIADADVYNAANVREVLLWGLRSKKAVWSFTRNIVEAGALAGQSIDAAAIGRQSAEIAKRVIGGKRIADIGLQYPDVVQTAVNMRTAELIGLDQEEKRVPGVTVLYPEKH